MDGNIDNHINIGKILYDVIYNNKSILLTTIPLFAAYHLQDNVFTRSMAAITTDVPGYFKDITSTKVFWTIAPRLGALGLFYVAGIASSKILAKIELDFTTELTGQVIESIKNTKRPVDVNDILVHIKKLAEVKNIYKTIVNYIAPTIIIGCGLIYNFIKADLKYGSMIILIIAMLIMITIYVESTTMESAYLSEKSVDEMYEFVHEIVLNMDSIITSNTNKKEMDGLKKKSEETFDDMNNCDTKTYNTSYFLYLISIIAMMVINYTAYLLFMQKAIDSKTFASIFLLTLLFIDYYIYCIGAFMDLVVNIGKYYESSIYFREFKEPSKKEVIKKDLIVTKGMIVFKNINQKYGDRVIFKNMNLKLEGGKKYGLIGPIGSGKTTLLKMLSGIVPYEGEIFVDMQSFDNVSDHSISKNIAYISQYPKLFNKTIYENISYATDYTKDQVIARLTEYDLNGFIDKFPNKLDTIVGKEGSNVSGGQRQLLAFIRALVQNKKIIILDEPSASLDIETKQILFNTLKRLKHHTLIISTHDQQLYPLFDHMIDISRIISAD